MARDTDAPRSESIDARNLASFLVVLASLVLAFVLVARRTGTDLLALGPLYMVTPAVAGLVVCLRDGIALPDVGLRSGDRRWIALAALSPLPLLGAVTVLSLAVPGVTFDTSIDLAARVGLPSGPVWTVVALCVVVLVGVTANAVLALGEEFGWRGYLLWELAPLGFWKASLAIGAVWGLWHAPLVLAGHNYPSYPFVGVAAFTITCVAMAPILTAIVVRSGSVLPAAVFHGVFNAVGLTGYAATDDPFLRQLVASEGGIVGIAVFACVAIGIARAGAPRLARDFASCDRPDGAGARRGAEDAVSAVDPSEGS